MDELIKESWLIYESHRNEEFVVTPFVPIFFFGDSEGYFASGTKVITVGLKPSRVEFPEEDRYSRFPGARDVYPHVLRGERYGEYVGALNEYFKNNPYRKWFNSYEPLLRGLGASYYDGPADRALHTDLCSPLATDPTWSKLTPAQKATLQPSGTALWHGLVSELSPDVIICSVAQSHLSNVNFPRTSGWKTIHTVRRERPYEVKAIEMDIGAGKRSLLVFGRAAQMPLATVSSADKQRIGESLKEYLRGQ